MFIRNYNAPLETMWNWYGPLHPMLIWMQNSYTHPASGWVPTGRWKMDGPYGRQGFIESIFVMNGFVFQNFPCLGQFMSIVGLGEWEIRHKRVVFCRTFLWLVSCIVMEHSITSFFVWCWSRNILFTGLNFTVISSPMTSKCVTCINPCWERFLYSLLSLVMIQSVRPFGWLYHNID